MQLDLTKQYVTIDTETSGLKPEEGAEIVEVCARRFKADGTLGKEFYTLCSTTSGHIPAEVTAINGITDEMIKDAASKVAR